MHDNVLPILNEYNISSTFLHYSWFGRRKIRRRKNNGLGTDKRLQEQGHEIGSHSMNHPRLTKITRKILLASSSRQKKS